MPIQLSNFQLCYLLNEKERNNENLQKQIKQELKATKEIFSQVSRFLEHVSAEKEELEKQHDSLLKNSANLQYQFDLIYNSLK